MQTHMMTELNVRELYIFLYANHMSRADKKQIEENKVICVLQK